jgi:hypothetical protein
MTFSIPTLGTRHCYALFQLCGVSFTSPFAFSVIMLNVVMLSIVVLLQSGLFVCKARAFTVQAFPAKCNETLKPLGPISKIQCK